MYVFDEANHEVSFEIAVYDATKPLIIDPVLSYSTYLGGSGSDFGGGITVDDSGAAYVTGGRNSTKFPTSLSAFQDTFGGNNTVGLGDVFVTKFDPSGTMLVYSTYLGGRVQKRSASALM